ncbi:LOW QUALITY PROTEIN: E3 ubiquitin-protein transferase MAEA-like [Ochotona princeps]|uniref:LOW QUALITY PROTEIN: E3 ubiquitin-protein transferase MAEA-like n=1 Tax=Ochotona princeps TaxID=9978 RepID=UPI0027151405|nr:LOW QUALITY PROTEIN: E3 ubiquitin-protein transferase MAEA-like [Ochotona princeps]
MRIGEEKRRLSRSSERISREILAADILDHHQQHHHEDHDDALHVLILVVAVVLIREENCKCWEQRRHPQQQCQQHQEQRKEEQEQAAEVVERLRAKTEQQQRKEEERQQQEKEEEKEQQQRKGGATAGAGASSGGRQQQHHNSVDRAFLRIPIECALRSFKSCHRKINRDIAVILSYLLKGKLAAQFLSDAASTEEKIKKLDVVIEKLQKVREKAQRGSAESRAYLLRCQKRLRRLVEEPDIEDLHSKEGFSYSFYGRRVAWEVHEYLCRSGMLATAGVMKDKLRLEPYTDTEVYEEVLEVLAGLLRQSTEAALAWVAEHRPKLKKLGSPFESELHVQHVLGLLQQRNAKVAVTYLKANVGPDDFARCSDIRKVVTLTALLEDPPPQYAKLFGADRWHRLSCLFLQTSAQVYGFSLKPTLIALLQAGFSALRSAACDEQKSASCPACLPEWREYVRRVPMPHRVQSFLICPISGELMDDKNPPLASPDGHVYSTKAVHALAAASADQKSILCPKTQQTYPLERFSRIYVT